MPDSALQEIVCCIGRPVAGNPTQFMMQRVLAKSGLDWCYLTLEVAPEDLADAMRGMAEELRNLADQQASALDDPAILERLRKLQELSAEEQQQGQHCVAIRQPQAGHEQRCHQRTEHDESPFQVAVRNVAVDRLSQRRGNHEEGIMMPQLLPDQSFYPSPAMAIKAAPEKHGYVALLNPDPTASDALERDPR